MKIGIIPPNSNTGEFKYCQYLFRGLIERGLEVELLNHRFLINRPNIKVFLGSLLLKKIVNKDIEILHNIDNLGPFLLEDSNSKLKRVLTVHDIAPVILPDIHSSIMKFDFKYILPKLIENSDIIIADSYFTKEDLERYFNVKKDKVDVAHLGVDLSFFYPRAYKEEVMTKYGINNDYLLYLGSDNPRKNLKNLILAYSRIYREIDEDLVLVGPINHDYLRTFIEKINRKGLSERVITPGYVDYDDLPLFYSGATALVFTSLYEGFGFAPLEAMACGSPVIVSNNSSITEVVGETGVYINNPLDPEEIANNISLLLNNYNLQKKLKNQGPERAKKFSWDNTIDETLKAYERVYEF